MPLHKPQKTMMLCTAFIAGCVAYFLNLIPLFAVIAVLLISFLAYKKIFSFKFSVLLLIVITFSVFYCGFKSPKPDKLYNISPTNVYLQGRVITEPQLNQENRSKFEFEVYSYSLDGKEWKSIKAKTIVNIYDKKKQTLKQFQGDNYRHVELVAKQGELESRSFMPLLGDSGSTQIKNNILIGDILEVKGYVKSPFEATNPGQFDYKNYLKNQGIFTIVSVNSFASPLSSHVSVIARSKATKQSNNSNFLDCRVGAKAPPRNDTSNYFKIIEHPKWGKWFLIQNLNKVKNKIIDENRKYIKSPKLEVLEGMVFGDFAVPAPDEIKQEFIKSGLSHLLAASGMNVGFIFGAWFFIASKLRTPYKFKMITGGILVAFYSLLTGLPPSIMRAAVMAEFLILAKLLDRKADNLIILVFVCALMLLIDPFLLANISFQLSFLTTFGILLCVPPLLDKLKPIPEVVSGVVIVPLIAQIWASPIQIFHFNNFSTYSLLANILVVPFIGAITFLGFIGSIFSFIPVVGGKLCWLFDKIAEPFIDIILFISGYISNLPHALYYLAKPEIIAIMIFYGLIIALLFVITKDFSSKKLNIAALILFLSLLVFVFKDNFDRKLKFVFFDVGQGDAILIHTPNNKNILVDTGPNEKYLPAKTSIIPYLRDKGINKLNAVVLTHQDSDHIGGTLEILKNINVTNIFHTGLVEDSKTCRKIKNYIQKNHINNRILSDGENINLDKNINIKAIRSYKNNENDNGIILYIVYKGFSSILMADCEANSIYDIKKYVKKPVNIIKIGHHGSYNSVNYTYLDYLKPQLAIISVGKQGYKYGHPNNQTLEELKEFNVKTLRTDKDFAVTISSDGTNYIYKTYKNQ